MHSVSVGLSALLLSSASFLGPGKAQNSCVRVPIFQQLPQFTNSGVWTNDGKELLLVDHDVKKIFRYLSDGRYVGTFTDLLSPALRDQSMQNVVKSGSNLLIEIKGGKILKLDQNKQRPSVSRALNFESKSHRGMRVSGLFQYSAIGDDLIAVSDVHDTLANRWFTAVVRVPLTGDANFEVIEDIGDFKAQSKIPYISGFPSIAAMGSSVFFLRFDLGVVPLLYKYDSENGGVERVSLPEPLTFQLPIFPPLETIGADKDLFYKKVDEAVNSEIFPAGLYAWEGNLYVLVRTPGKNRVAPRWHLIRFNPADATRYTKIELDLHNNPEHLTLVPGPVLWAVVEKGPIEGFGLQGVKHLEFFPSNLFANTKRQKIVLTCG